MFLRLISTISPVEAGMTHWLAQGFFHQYGIEVQVSAAGTTQAMEKAQAGLADVLLVHAPALEMRFVQAGYATSRHALMSTDFLILGPADSPRSICQASPDKALQIMAHQGLPFLSRADFSGTHLKELELLEHAGIEPGWPGYQSYAEGHRGNQATLKKADQLGCYVLTDRVTYLTLYAEISHRPLVQHHPLLRNPMSLLPIHPDKIPGVNHLLAMRFIQWACSEDVQAGIKNFKQDQYGEILFFPDAKPYV